MKKINLLLGTLLIVSSLFLASCANPTKQEDQKPDIPKDDYSWLPDTVPEFESFFYNNVVRSTKGHSFINENDFYDFTFYDDTKNDGIGRICISELKQNRANTGSTDRTANYNITSINKDEKKTANISFSNIGEGFKTVFPEAQDYLLTIYKRAENDYYFSISSKTKKIDFTIFPIFD